MRFVRFTLTSALIFIGAIVMGSEQPARAGAPSEQTSVDVLPVVVIVEAVSLLGEDTVILPGWLEVRRQPSRLEGATEVADLEIVNLELRGASRLGLVSVVERPDEGEAYRSTGEIRSLQPGTLLPASSFIELSLDLDLPATIIGPLQLHNETPLRLVPAVQGQATPLDVWPPLGVTFQRMPAPTGGELDCIPLVTADNSETDLELCIRGLTLEIAPLLPSYSVARGSPGSLHPADILALMPRTATAGSGQAPFVRIACAALGLTGCGPSGTQDDIDALSFGDGPAATGSTHFSVGPGAVGVAGSAVAAQSACPPAKPGLSPEPETDVFVASSNGSNSHILDGNGPVGACSPAFPLGLIESIASRANLNALDRRDSAAVDADADGVPERAVYFSLDAASPSLEAFGFSAADVLTTANGAQPSVYASASALGLQQGDDIDALCLHDNGDGVYGGGDSITFSLTPDSPTLGDISAGPGDLLTPGSPLTVVESAAALGLAAGDDVNAASCAPAPAVGDGDVNCDGETNSIDAALVLQHTAVSTRSIAPQAQT
ncbi:MAG: hypothetical protein IIB87_04100 [Chloroflexi bacterium]|nr:hypothetical protein [Chloroflexota bacterium]